MNTLMQFTNNESAYNDHRVYIIPDGADDKELREIASEDINTFKDAVACFCRVFPEYYKDGGLFVGGSVF